MKINKKKTYIIAEIGINHEGSYKLAKKLIINAALAGADAVKFQMFNPITLVSSGVKKTHQQKKILRKKESLAEMWNRMTFRFKEWQGLQKIAKKKSLDFICSIFDDESFIKAKKIGVDAIKIASSDLTDYKLLSTLKKTSKPIILSTGMGSLNEIKNAIKKITSKKIYILHCVSLYPCPPNKANIKRILSLKKEFKNKIGYSDHTLGINSCILAISLGAQIIEKHFTLNKNKVGGDHILSADFKDLKEICKFAKEYNILMGTGKIEPSKKEIKMRKFFRKSVFAKIDINIGEKLNYTNLDTRRPEKGIPSEKIEQLLGKVAKRKIKKNQIIKKNYFK
tara:strand:- start:8912 stop:9925 length:1014 start_codon:yes stop_codon:yes gene_type:complete